MCVQVVFRHPHFISYFRNVTPEEELGGLNIGSRPARYGIRHNCCVAYLAALAASTELRTVKLSTGNTERTLCSIRIINLPCARSVISTPSPALPCLMESLVVSLTWLCPLDGNSVVCEGGRRAEGWKLCEPFLGYLPGLKTGWPCLAGWVLARASSSSTVRYDYKLSTWGCPPPSPSPSGPLVPTLFAANVKATSIGAKRGS